MKKTMVRKWRVLKVVVSRKWRQFLHRFGMRLGRIKSPVNRQNYFKSATSWSDDLYVAAVVSRNRFRFALVAAICLIFLLVICVTLLIPLQHLEPLAIHHYQDGRVLVNRVAADNVLHTAAQIDNDLVRYVVNRESYDPIAYEEQYRLTLLLSHPKVARAYIDGQSASNAASLINVLANHQYRTVHVDDVVVLDQVESSPKPHHSSHRNLAEVHFVVTDHFISTGVMHSHPYTVLLSWMYGKPSSDPEVRWRNWDGFIITHYQKNQRSLSKGET